MKKLLLVVVIAVFAVANTNAQKETGVGRPSLSIGVEGALPIGDFNKINKFGIGGTLKGAFPVASDLDLTLTAGYITFPGKTILNLVKLPSLNTIPIKAGVRYRFAGGPYVEPQLGYTLQSYKGGSSTGAFTYAANVGFMFSPEVDLGVRYEAMSKDGTAGFIGARLAYSFNL